MRVAQYFDALHRSASKINVVILEGVNAFRSLNSPWGVSD